MAGRFPNAHSGRTDHCEVTTTFQPADSVLASSGPLPPPRNHDTTVRALPGSFVNASTAGGSHMRAAAAPAASAGTTSRRRSAAGVATTSHTAPSTTSGRARAT